MKKDDLLRIVIIGNSGSGKSYLARQLDSLLQQKVIHLDELFWEPGGFNRKRPKDIVNQEVITFSDEPSWIMEGVFGELASLALPKAKTLIFLDKNWDECRGNLNLRGSESSKQLDPITAEANFKELLIWAEAYWDRQNLKSFTAHNNLFNEFAVFKIRIKSPEEGEEFLRNVSKV